MVKKSNINWTTIYEIAVDNLTKFQFYEQSRGNNKSVRFQTAKTKSDQPNHASLVAAKQSSKLLLPMSFL